LRALRIGNSSRISRAKTKVINDWPRMLEDLTDGTFNNRAVDTWPVGEDLVVAHIEVEMTIGDVRHQGMA
jgi:hypothetical protein